MAKLSIELSDTLAEHIVLFLKFPSALVGIEDDTVSVEEFLAKYTVLFLEDVHGVDVEAEGSGVFHVTPVVSVVFVAKIFVHKFGDHGEFLIVHDGRKLKSEGKFGLRKTGFKRNVFKRGNRSLDPTFHPVEEVLEERGLIEVEVVVEIR